ncbi:MAG: class I SAM-dependent methyltransferase [Thermoplasmata archaeon]
MSRRGSPERSIDRLVAGFGTVATAYERSRPEYPAAAYDLLRSQFGLKRGATVIDLAAGTGKFTRGLVGTRAAIVAIEPTAGMRRVFRRAVPGLPVLDGSAEVMSVPDGFADAVTVAQAFHWFHAPRALSEIHRVLRPGGGLALVWNERDESVDWMRELSDLIQPLRHRAPGYRGANWRTAFAHRRSFTPLRHRRFRHSQRLDVAGAVDRVRSISFVAIAPRPVQARIARSVRSLLRTHPDTRGRSVIEFPYRTDVYWCFRSR